jgi:transposase-like protein
MASVLHGSARTTPRVRAELQASKESSRALAARYGLNAKTVRKWHKQTTTGDALMGPKKPTSTVLTPAEEAIVVAFRQKTLPPLDDVLGCLKEAIPNLSRSALHRCLQRAMASRGFPSRRHRSAARGSRLTRSATSASTVVNCVMPGASWSCSWPSTARRQRNLIERMFCRPKDWRRIATRYDKLAANFAAAIIVAWT